MKRRNSNHHIVPISKGGTNDPSNVARIDRHKHELYHEVFGNRTPEQTLNYLVDYFWKGQVGWIKTFLFERRIL